MKSFQSIAYIGRRSSGIMFRYLGILLFLSVSCIFRCSFAQTGCNNNEVGYDDRNDDKIGNAGNDAYYLIDIEPYISTCCARLDEWEISVKDENEPVDLMIWRPTTTNNYELVFSQTVTPNEKKRYTVAAAGNFLIQPNDLLGWHSSAGEVLAHKDDNNDGRNAKYITGLAASVGDEKDWSAATVETDGKSAWNILITVKESQRPVFSSTPVTFSKPDNEAPGLLTTIAFTDADDADQLTLTMSSSPYFTFTDNNDFTGTVTLSSSLQPINGGSETLTFTATDRCGRTGTGSIKITVVNTPPTIFFLNATKPVAEDVTVKTEIDTFVCNDTGPVTASIAINPANIPTNTKPFFEISATSATEFAIYARSQTTASQGVFNFTQQDSYTITVTCNDGLDSVTDSIVVTLVQNQAPVITNLPTNISVPESATDGTVVFNLTHTDFESNDVFYSCTCDGIPAAQCPVECHDSGQVQLTMNLNSLDTSVVKGFDIRVTIRDAKNTGLVKTLTMIISDINHAPKFVNLPTIITVDENKAIGTVLWTISFTDSNALDTHTFSMTNAVGGNALFGVHSTTGVISTLAALDYETLNPKSYVFVVVLSDGEDPTTATVTIFVNDINEILSFTSNPYRTDVLERRPTGYLLTGTGIAIVDPDQNESHLCTMDCGALSGYYVMSTDCTIRVASVYTLDTGNTNQIVCIISAVDKGNLTATTTLSITVGDNNDYTPSFNRSTYAFNVGAYDGVNVAVGTVAASDSDIGDNGTFYLVLDQSGLNDTYFNIDQTSGAITTRLVMSACNCSGTTLTIPVIATDTGKLKSTATVYITVGALTTTPAPTTTTDWYKTFFTDEGNLVWFALVMALLAVTLAVGVFICLKYVFMWKGRCCKFNRSKQWQPRDDVFDDRRRSNRHAPTLVQCRQPPPQGEHSWQKHGRRM